MSFSTRMKDARESKGLTLKELAKKIGKTEATVQRYESGEIKNLKNDTIESIASALSVSPAYLMGWSEQKESTENNISQRARAVARKYDGLSIAKQEALDLLIKSMREDDEDDE